MIKIKADILKTFVEKCTANATIKDVKLNFTPERLEMTHKDEPGVIFIAGVLLKSAFAQYEECSISLPVTQALIDTLSSFIDNIINIVSENNIVRILDENGGIDLVQAENVVSSQEGIPALKYDNKILVKKSMIETLIARDKIVKSENVSVKVSNKELIMEIGAESNKAHTKAIASYEGELNSVFDLNYFKSLTEKLDTIFDLSLSSEGLPAMIEEKTDKYHIIYFMTPISDEDIREKAIEQVKELIEENRMAEENKQPENNEEVGTQSDVPAESSENEGTEESKDKAATTEKTFKEESEPKTE